MTLPPGWARYTTDDGKEYFHNSATSTTQWDKPLDSDSLSLLSSTSSTSEVYQYNPTNTDLELQQQQSSSPVLAGSGGKLVGMHASPSPEFAGKAPGGHVPTMEHDAMAFARAPNGQMSHPSSSASASGGSFQGFGGAIVGGMMAAASAATSEDSAGMSGIAGTFLTYAQQYFNVSSDDVIKRLKRSLVPYPPQLHGAENEYRIRPDFWGPFWVATTTILFFAATGNFARLLATQDHKTFKADYGLVSMAASMIYGILIGVPFLTRVALWVSGHEVDSINFQQMICVYGYSLSPCIPVSILCLIPVELIRWLAVIAGCAASLVFIRENLLMDIGIETPSLKWKMTAVFCVVQAGVFIVYRVHFFD